MKRLSLPSMHCFTVFPTHTLLCESISLSLSLQVSPLLGLMYFCSYLIIHCDDIIPIFKIISDGNTIICISELFAIPKQKQTLSLLQFAAVPGLAFLPSKESPSTWTSHSALTLPQGTVLYFTPLPSCPSISGRTHQSLQCQNNI